MEPQSEDIEEAVLGAMMLEKDCVDTILQILDAEMFHKSAHSIIYESIETLFSNNNPIDILTVQSELEKQNKLEQVGGVYYLNQLVMKVGSAMHVSEYAKIVFEKHVYRSLITAGRAIINEGFNVKADLQDAISNAEAELNKVVNLAAGKESIPSIGTIVDEAIDEAFTRIHNAKNGQPAGISTGLHALDNLTTGWQKSSLIILAGRPAMGKTAVMLSFAKAAAMAGHSTVIFSLEMSATELANRMIVAESGIRSSDFRSGFMHDDDIKKIEPAGNKISSLKISIDDKASTTIGHIRARARALQKQDKCDIIMIDYLQLIEGMKLGSGVNQVNIISEISRQSKILAKELNIPVIMLSQLSRECEKRADKRPQLSDLRDSGAIEQDADMVCLLYRPSYYGIEMEDRDTHCILPENTGILIVAKHRAGACADIKFSYNSSMTEIRDF